MNTRLNRKLFAGSRQICKSHPSHGISARQWTYFCREDEINGPGVMFRPNNGGVYVNRYGLPTRRRVSTCDRDRFLLEANSTKRREVQRKSPRIAKSDVFLHSGPKFGLLVPFAKRLK